MHVTRGTGRDGVRGGRPVITIRVATAEDFESFYGERPKGTSRATAAIMEGKCVGLIGVTRDESWGVYFSDFKDDLRPYLRSVAIMRAIKDSLKYCSQYRGPVLSLANDGEGCRLLNRLGFTHLHGGWYGWL